MVKVFVTVDCTLTAPGLDSYRICWKVGWPFFVLHHLKSNRTGLSVTSPNSNEVGLGRTDARAETSCVRRCEKIVKSMSSENSVTGLFGWNTILAIVKVIWTTMWGQGSTELSHISEMKTLMGISRAPPLDHLLTCPHIRGVEFLVCTPWSTQQNPIPE